TRSKSSIKKAYQNMKPVAAESQPLPSAKPKA
nr:hypothetical protein [Tanacetum cinerariifolium]